MLVHSFLNSPLEICPTTRKPAKVKRVHSVSRTVSKRLLVAKLCLF